MAVSPADFELYARVTGRRARTPEEQMALAPEVFNFTRNLGRGGYSQPQSNVLRDVVGNVGKLALLGLAGGAVQGLYQQQNPESVNNSVVTEAPVEDLAPQTVAEELQSRIAGSPAGQMPEKVSYDDPLVQEAVSYLEASDNIDTPNSDFIDSVSVNPEGEVNVTTFPSETNTQDKRALYASQAGVENPHDQYLYNQMEIQDSDTPEVRQWKAHKLQDILQEVNTASEVGGVGSIYNNQLRNNPFVRTSFGEGTTTGAEPGGTVAIYPQSPFNNTNDGGGGGVVIDDGPMSPETVIDGTQGSNTSALAPSTSQPVPESDKGGGLQQEVDSYLSNLNSGYSDWNQGVKWGQTFDSALSSGSPVKGAGIVAGAVAQKGAGDVITRGKKIVEQVPKTIKKVGEGIQEAANVITHEQIKASTFAEAARIQAGLPPLLGNDVVEIGNESDLSDNAQFDDAHQINEQNSPAGLNRQETTQTVIDLANTLSKGLAHLSPEDRLDLARKMLEGGNNL